MTIDYKAVLEKAGSERKAAVELGMSRITFVNALYKSLNLCVQCKQVAPKVDCTRCADCLVKAKSKVTKEEKSAYNREYREKNSKKLADYNKNYQKNNLPRFRKARAKYDSTEAGKISAERRRIKRLSYQDAGMPILDLEYLRQHINACENCGVTENLTLDHHIPLSKGGNLTLENTNILCVSCNSSKNAKMPADYFKPEILAKIEAKFLTLGAFREVTSPKEYEVNYNPYKVHCRNFLEIHHYLKSCPGVIYSMTLNYKGRTIGVAVFSKPSRQTITYPGLSEHPLALLELSRFFILDGTPKNTESYFLSKCLNFLSRNSLVEVIISYADTTEGHTGSIYKACNFELLGETKENYHYEDTEGTRIHKRQVWDRSRYSNISEKEQAALENLKVVKEAKKFKFIYKLK